MPEQDSSRLPDPRAQTGAWAVAALVAWALVLSAHPPTLGTWSGTALLALAGVSVAASLLEFEAQARVWGRDVQQGITLTESAFVLLLLTVPAGWAWSLTLGGYVVANVLLHPKPLRNVFNGAVWSVSLALAVGVHELVRPDVAGITPAAVGAVAVAVLVHTVVNYVAVSLVVAASTGTDPRRELLAAFAMEPWLTVGTLSLGLVAAAAWEVAPWLVLVVGIIAMIVRHGHRHAVRSHDAVDQLRVERDRLREVVSATDRGLVVTDRHGSVLLWNTAMGRLAGTPPDDATGRHLDDVLGGRLALDGLPGEPLSLLPAETQCTGWLVDEDGERRRVEVRRVSQFDRLGAHVADVLHFRDRTAEYEVARLKDDFLSRVSHELRTPLTTIIGFARTLQGHRDELDGAMLARLEDGIIRRSEELTTLVDDLLLVARAQRGTDVIGGETVALEAVVARAVEDEARRWPGHAVHVSAVGPVRAIADPSALSTVVRHLVSNACKFSPADSAVEVEVARTEPDEASIRVTDHGRGIPRARLEEIFGRFTRLEDPLRMETRGAGMGLHVVDRLVADMAGRIEVDSTPGQGSTFTVHLPAPATDGDERLRSAVPTAAA